MWSPEAHSFSLRQFVLHNLYSSIFSILFDSSYSTSSRVIALCLICSFFQPLSPFHVSVVTLQQMERFLSYLSYFISHHTLRVCAKQRHKLPPATLFIYVLQYTLLLKIIATLHVFGEVLSKFAVFQDVTLCIMKGLYRSFRNQIVGDYRNVVVRDRIPVETKLLARPDRPWGTTSLFCNGYRVFPGGKVRPRRVADHSPPCSAAVMEE